LRDARALFKTHRYPDILTDIQMDRYTSKYENMQTHIQLDKPTSRQRNDRHTDGKADL